MASALAPVNAAEPLTLVHVRCCLCGVEDADPVGVGEDFEYHTSPDAFLAMRCRRCGLIFLNPRPAESELDRIYPPSYHAFDFSPERYGFVYRVRRRLEARRALAWCRGLAPEARILDVGCGDGFHLRLLRDFGPSTWQLEGIDANEQAVHAALRAGVTAYHGTVETARLEGRYDLAMLIATIEHVADPIGVLSAVKGLLKPGGRVVIVTDNTDTADFRIAGSRYWGGYHFPRHWNLFDRKTLTTLAQCAGLEVESLSTQMSPVNWVYSIRNALVDWRAPRWLVEQFSLRAPLSLAVFTAVDGLFQLGGRGALLRAVLRA